MIRDLFFFDLETATTGPTPDPEEDRIVSFGFFTAQIADGSATGIVTSGIEMRFNPGIIMTPENIDIHGITNEMAAEYPPFSEYAEEILNELRGKTIAGYNIRAYDVPVLWHAFARAGIEWDWRSHPIIDSYTLYAKREPRDLKAALRFYCGDELTNAHNACDDAEASARILLEQMTHYQLHAMSDQELATETAYADYLDISRKITTDEHGQPAYAFGKHKGKTVLSERPYAQWMLDKGDFSADTKRVLIDILSGAGT